MLDDPSTSARAPEILWLDALPPLMIFGTFWLIAPVLHHTVGSIPNSVIMQDVQRLQPDRQALELPQSLAETSVPPHQLLSSLLPRRRLEHPDHFAPTHIEDSGFHEIRPREEGVAVLAPQIQQENPRREQEEGQEEEFGSRRLVVGEGVIRPRLMVGGVIKGSAISPVPATPVSPTRRTIAIVATER